MGQIEILAFTVLFSLVFGVSAANYSDNSRKDNKFLLALTVILMSVFCIFGFVGLISYGILFAFILFIEFIIITLSVYYIFKGIFKFKKTRKATNVLKKTECSSLFNLFGNVFSKYKDIPVNICSDGIVFSSSIPVNADDIVEKGNITYIFSINSFPLLNNNYIRFLDLDLDNIQQVEMGVLSEAIKKLVPIKYDEQKFYWTIYKEKTTGSTGGDVYKVGNVYHVSQNTLGTEKKIVNHELQFIRLVPKVAKLRKLKSDDSKSMKNWLN